MKSAKTADMVKKFLNKPTVELTLDAIFETIFRAKPIYWGGLLMTFGIISSLAFSQYYGYQLNNSLIIYFFLVGYFIALFAEVISGSLRK